MTGLDASSVAIWSAITSRSLGSLLFCIAAFVPVRPLRRSGRALASVAACVAGGLALIFPFSWALARWLPSPVTVAAPAGMQVRPVPHAAPVLLGLEMVAAAFAVLAAVGYVRRSRRFGDEFSGWLAIAAVFAAAAGVNYFVYPSLYGGVVSTGDAFRLGFYAVLLIGSIHEIWSYWVALSDTRMASERRRIARDLHDGVAQELAYLSRHLDSLEGDVQGEALGRLRRVAERARLESRLAISGLAVVTNPATGESGGGCGGRGGQAVRPRSGTRYRSGPLPSGAVYRRTGPDRLRGGYQRRAAQRRWPCGSQPSPRGDAGPDAGAGQGIGRSVTDLVPRARHSRKRTAQPGECDLLRHC